MCRSACTVTLVERFERMMTPLRSSSNRTFIIVALAGAFVGSFAVLAAIGIGPLGSAQTDLVEPDPSPVINLSETGRLIFPILIDGARMDESGQPIPGEEVFITQTCEADALAVIKDGRVTDLQVEGTAASIAVGERLKGPVFHEGVHEVYRDANGDLRFGCDPDSVVIIKIEEN